MSAKIYVEGGGEDASSLSSCREGFRKLLEKAGLKERMPKIVACGGRQSAYKDFVRGHRAQEADFVGLLVDSEEPMADTEKPWAHLESRPSDPMPRPMDATDEQAMVMATCMETWIVADRAALARVYKGGCLQEGALPPLFDLESRDRHAVQGALEHATRNCGNAYRKGKRSFRTLEEVEPDRIRPHLASFRRMETILEQRL